jgi:hypothetical protein
MPETSQIPVRKATKIKLKQEAAAMDCTMIDLIDEIIIEWIEKNKKRERITKKGE